MVLRKLLCLGGFILLAHQSLGQDGSEERSRTATYAEANYLRVFSENDFLQLPIWRSDRFYTNGLKVEYLTSSFDLKVLDKVLMGLTTEPLFFRFYGFSLGQNFYTPSDIKISSLMENDRPYSGWLYLSVSRITSSRIKEKRMKSELFLGVLGPISFSGEVQTEWHELINSPEPKGWHHQIRNDVGVNYHLTYESLLLSNKGSEVCREVAGILRGNVGTVFVNAGGGFLFRHALIKKLVPYFDQGLDLGTIPVRVPGRRKLPAFRSFFFARPLLDMVGYNAMLQGGLINKVDSELTISAKDVSRLVFDFDYGLVFEFPRAELSVTAGQAIRSREFSAGLLHRWGYVTLVKGLGCN